MPGDNPTTPKNTDSPKNSGPSRENPESRGTSRWNSQPPDRGSNPARGSGGRNDATRDRKPKDAGKDPNFDKHNAKERQQRMEPIQSKDKSEAVLGFTHGKSDLDGKNQKALDGIKEKYDQAVQTDPKTKIEIGGSASRDGSAASNQALSEKRTQSAKDYLVSKGVPAENIKTYALGETPAEQSGVPDGQDGRQFRSAYVRVDTPTSSTQPTDTTTRPPKSDRPKDSGGKPPEIPKEKRKHTEKEARDLIKMQGYKAKGMAGKSALVGAARARKERTSLTIKIIEKVAPKFAKTNLMRVVREAATIPGVLLTQSVGTVKKAITSWKDSSNYADAIAGKSTDAILWKVPPTPSVAKDMQQYPQNPFRLMIESRIAQANYPKNTFDKYIVYWAQQGVGIDRTTVVINDAINLAR